MRVLSFWIQELAGLLFVQVGHDTAVFSGQGGSMDPAKPAGHLNQDGDQYRRTTLAS